MPVHDAPLAPASTSAEGALDSDKIAELTAAIGHDRVIALLREMIEHVECELALLRGAAHAPEAVARHVHSMKGLALNFGAVDLARAISRLALHPADLGDAVSVLAATSDAVARLGQVRSAGFPSLAGDGRRLMPPP